MKYLIPNNGPFFFPGGDTGCILLHGFSSMPEEMLPLGEYLAEAGHTALGLRLAGHGTRPEDLKHTRWTNWLEDLEDGLSLLSKVSTRQVLIGQSMGGMIALTAAAYLEIAGVVALSTPFDVPRRERMMDGLAGYLSLTIRKRVPRFAADHPLYRRRELNYPSYPDIPTRILPELDQLSDAMITSLPLVKAPVLLIQSRDDHDVPFTNMQSVYDHLGSQNKAMLAVEGLDHSLVQDPRRGEVFAAIVSFIEGLGG